MGVDQHEIIADDQGNRNTPSYVAFTKKVKLFGDLVKDQVSTNTCNTIFGMSNR
jgi:L1 cell adhesion molecule like protein